MPRSNTSRHAALMLVPVDLALVLAIDTSGSVSEDRMALQINGYAGAFGTPELLGAVQKGHLGRIAASFVQWSDTDRQALAVDWTVISDAASAQGFGRALTEAVRPTPGWTSISGAIDYSARLFARSGVASMRRVIDISGDGPNNDGRPVTEARDAAVAADITINGLPILEIEPELDSYYRNNVVGGPDAFIVAVHDLADFAGAVLRKLLVEVAGIDAPPRLRG
jgi:predicted GNAT family acetyltransferase